MSRVIADLIIIGSLSILAVSIIVLTGIRDASMPERKFDCRILIGSWHPDVSKDVIEACRKKRSII